MQDPQYAYDGFGEIFRGQVADLLDQLLLRGCVEAHDPGRLCQQLFYLPKDFLSKNPIPRKFSWN